MIQAGKTRVKPRRGPDRDHAPAHKKSIWNDGTSSQQLSCIHEGDTQETDCRQIPGNRPRKDPRKQTTDRSQETDRGQIPGNRPQTDPRKQTAERSQETDRGQIPGNRPQKDPWGRWVSQWIKSTLPGLLHCELTYPHYFKASLIGFPDISNASARKHALKN